VEHFGGNQYHVTLDVVLQLGEAPPYTACHRRVFDSNNVVISAALTEVCALLCAVLVVVYVSLTVVLFVVSLCNK